MIMIMIIIMILIIIIILYGFETWSHTEGRKDRRQMKRV
jgi:hypothetical protein